MDRFQWSRKLFTLARLALGELRSTNDLETIQCLIFMAKVCQNELNAHLGFMYLGMAVRASLSAGYHRGSISREKTHTLVETATEISKTWWGLYSLEVEMSFSLGRPDSLGLEE
jgi:Fungal specific transcription factor domain